MVLKDILRKLKSGFWLASKMGCLFCVFLLINGCDGKKTVGNENLEPELAINGIFIVSIHSSEESGLHLFEYEFKGTELIRQTQLTNKSIANDIEPDIQQDRFNAFEPKIHSDGNLVVFKSGVYGFDTPTIWIYDRQVQSVRVGLLEEMVYPRSGFYPVWHPFEYKVTYRSFGFLPYMFDYETLESTYLISALGLQVTNPLPIFNVPFWSPDGRKMAFTSNFEADGSTGGKWYLYIVDLETLALQRIDAGGSPVWKSGSEITVQRGDGIYTHDLNSGTETLELMHPEEFFWYRSLKWTEDGAYLVLLGSSTFAIYDVEQDYVHYLFNIYNSGADWMRIE